MAARWTSTIGLGLRAVLSRRARRLADGRWWAANAASVQRDQLRTLLTKASGTEIGRDRGFGKVLSAGDADLVRAYRDAVQRVEYEEIREPLARMREGAQPDVFWPGLVRNWAETSGTTGGQKFIPVSDEMMKSNHRAALDIFAHGARMGVSLGKLFGGRVVFLGGSTDLTEDASGIRTGDLSALVTPLIRWPISAVYSPGREIALMSDWPKKIDTMARTCLRQDVRGISGMASWSLVLFQKVLELAAAEGRPVRTVRELWPDFELFIHGGVKYTPFDRRVREAWSGDPTIDVPHRLEVYPASEGFIAMQDTAGDPGLRLNTDIGIFYEFIPLEEIDSADARAFTCEEVEPGQRYVVCMTTCAGLWRYVIGDVVEFDTIPPDGPPRLRIVGRHRHFVNAFGENLIVEEIERAVVAATEATGASVGEFTAGPVYPGGDGDRGALELAIEWAETGVGVGAFAEVFDRTLREINVDYSTKRTGDLGMAPARVSPAPMGVFHRWMASRGRLGGQNKCPRCANHREYLDGVLRFAEPEGAPAGGVA